MSPVRGFTLLELIIVLIISMLLITIGIPGFQTLIQNNRLSSVAASIHSQLLFARSQSVSLINYVTVCPLESNECTDSWINGLDVFIDSNQSKTYDNGEVLLQSGNSFNVQDTLYFPRKGVTYTPDGQITGSSADFRYCMGDNKIGVRVSYNGRSKIIDGSTFTDCN
jgi:Tfp pilus assembly protein FimT